VVDHKDGDESNGARWNLRYLCKSCNTREGKRMARTGQGVRTRQRNPKRPTQAQVRAAARAAGMVAKWDRDWQEWIVNFPGGAEATSYHTDDPQDAIDTARAMARSRPRSNPELRIGDRVRYSTAFLRSTGMYSGPMPFARGIVTGLDAGFGGKGAYLATIDWGDPDIPERVLSSNLQLDRGKGWRKANPGIFEIGAGLDLLTDLAEQTTPRGRRNPEGAPNLAAYLQALGVLKGEVDGDFQAARTLIHNTPAADRSAFAREVWRRRRAHGTDTLVPF
jgi:hypothetical protein